MKEAPSKNLLIAQKITFSFLRVLNFRKNPIVYLLFPKSIGLD
jgi:hypothetical protein